MELQSADPPSVADDAVETKIQSHGEMRSTSCGSNGTKASPIDWRLGTYMKKIGSVLTQKRLILSWGEGGAYVSCGQKIAVERSGYGGRCNGP
jgi:hypothetical protein